MWYIATVKDFETIIDHIYNIFIITLITTFCYVPMIVIAEKSLISFFIVDVTCTFCLITYCFLRYIDKKNIESNFKSQYDVLKNNYHHIKVNFKN